MFDKFVDNNKLTVQSILQGAVVGSVVVGLGTLALFRRSIRKRLEKIYSSTFFGKDSKDPFRLIRDPALIHDEKNRHVSVIDLNPEFVRKYQGTYKMMSLGTYLSTLRPSIMSDELPKWLEGELQAAIGFALLRALGPTIGTALLPGAGFLDTFTARIARLAVSFFTKKEGQPGKENPDDKLVDHSGMPLTLYNVSFVKTSNAVPLSVVEST